MKDGKLEVYVGCGLTHAPEEFRISVEGLKEVLRQKRGYEVYDFVGLENGTPADVYAWEIGTAVEKHQKPTLAVAHKDTHITRLVPGAAEAGAPNYRFRRYNDLMEVPDYIAEMLEEAKPRYQMVVNGNEEWHPIRDAGVVYDSGWVPVSIGGSVRELDLTRDITDEERRRIADMADEYSGSK
jgi:hypothetical protein